MTQAHLVVLVQAPGIAPGPPAFQTDVQTVYTIPAGLKIGCPVWIRTRISTFRASHPTRLDDGALAVPTGVEPALPP